MSIQLDSTANGKVTFKTKSSGDVIFTLPNSLGNPGDVLTTDGAGDWSFAPPPVSSGTGGDLPVPTATVRGGVLSGGANCTIDANGRISFSGAAGGMGNVVYTDVTHDGDTIVQPQPASNYGLSSVPIFESTLYYVINFANYWPINSTEDCSLKLNETLMFARTLARSMRSEDYYTATINVRARVFMPVNNYWVKNQIVVPSYVELDCKGLMIRNWNGGATTYTRKINGVDTTFPANLSNTFMPTVVVTPFGHLGDLTVVCHVSGEQRERGSGVALGKMFRANGVSVVDKGANYVRGDVVTLKHYGQKGSSSEDPFQQTRLVVDTVDANGGITAVSIIRPGDYDIALREQVKLGHYTSSFVEANTNPHRQDAGKALGEHASYTDTTLGTNATFKVTSYTSDFSGGRYRVYEGNSPFAQQLIGHLNVIEANDDLDASGFQSDTDDPTYGFHFGVLCSTKNVEINRVYTRRGRIGISFRDGSDARISNMNTVLSGVGFHINGYSALTCSNFALDSCTWRAIEMQGCTGINLRGRCFWENNNDKAYHELDDVNATRVFVRSHDGGQAVRIGWGGDDGQLCSGLDLEIQLTNVGADIDRPLQPAVFVDRMAQSRIDITLCNTEYSGRPESDTKKVGWLFEFGTDKASSQFAPDPSGVLLKNTNRIFGQVDNISGAIYKGDPHENYLKIWDGVAEAEVRTGGRYHYERTVHPTSQSGVGKAVQGSTWMNTVKNIEWRNYGSAAAPEWRKVILTTPIVPGKWYSPVTAVTTMTPVTGRVYVTPIVIREVREIAALGIRVATAGATGAQARLGIYYDNGAGNPGSLFRDFGTVAVDSTGNKAVNLATPVTLNQQIVWLAVTFSNASTMPSVFCNNATAVSFQGGEFIGQDTIGGCFSVSGETTSGFYRDIAYGALPAPFGTPVANKTTNTPVVAISYDS